MSTPVPLARQLRCAQRELALRKRNYPRWVAAESMDHRKAQDEIDDMQAIVHTLSRLCEEESGQQRLWPDLAL